MDTPIFGIRVRTWTTSLLVAFAITCLFAPLVLIITSNHDYADTYPTHDNAMDPSTNNSSSIPFFNHTSPPSGVFPPKLSAGPAHRREKARRQETAEDHTPGTEEGGTQKSYEGDEIASGQEPPVDVQGAEKSAAQKLIPLYVVAGIVVMVITGCVARVVLLRNRH